MGGGDDKLSLYLVLPNHSQGSPGLAKYSTSSISLFVVCKKQSPDTSRDERNKKLTLITCQLLYSCIHGSAAAKHPLSSNQSSIVQFSEWWPSIEMENRVSRRKLSWKGRYLCEAWRNFFVIAMAHFYISLEVVPSSFRRQFWTLNQNKNTAHCINFDQMVKICIAEPKVFKATLTYMMLSLVPKKGQATLEMANLLCGPDVAGKKGGRSSSPSGTPNGSRARKFLFSGIKNNKIKQEQKPFNQISKSKL